MARTGPFTINGLTFETDAGGAITRRIAAVPERTTNPTKERLQKLRVDKDLLIIETTKERDKCQAELDKLTQESADLLTLIDNAS